MRAERKVTIILLCAIILLALFLQLYSLIDGLSHDDIWMAEIMKANLSTLAGFSGVKDINNVSPDDGPLYFIIMHFWIRVFGVNEASLLSFSILFGLLCIPLMYFLGKKLFNRHVGLLSAFLLSISVYFVENSQLVRPYALYLFLSILSTFFFCDYLENYKKKSLVLFGIFSFLNLYTQYFAFLLLDIQVLFAILFMKKKRKEFLATFVMLYLIAAPLLAGIPSAFLYNQEAAGPNPCHTFAFFNSVHYNVIQSSLMIFLILLFITGLKAKHENKYVMGLGAMVFFIPVIFSAAISCLVLFKIKHLIFAFPFFFAIISNALLNLKKQSRLIVLSLIIVMSIFSLADYYQRPIHSDWKSSFRYINDNLEEGDLVIISDYANRPAGYYLNTKPLIAKQYEIGELRNILQNYRRVWTVCHDETWICEDCKTPNMNDILNYLGTNYNRVEKRVFPGGETLHDIPAMDININLYEVK